MSVLIGHASINENGKVSGSEAGDQTGKEVYIREWYNKGWNVLMRCKDPAKRELIAKAMEAACKNDNIGYDQGDRTSLFYYAKNKNWDIAAVDVPCECDCSSLVAVCVNAAGISVSKDIYTGNERASLLATGEFESLMDRKYLETSDYALRGDILLLEGSHTAVCLTDGSKVLQGSWEHLGTTWKYKKSNGDYAADEWILYKQHWYRFDRFGNMITGKQMVRSADHGDELYFFASTELGEHLEGSLMHTNSRGALTEWIIDEA